uniref:Capsid protein VP n=1 Tax=Ficedula mugimaki parvoviridae sp. TaxID=2794480 RepID=A0A8E7L4R2_9VIRU|nr:MAG: capsid protein VP [Ficedula mugimaki parvoviridae sp.]
MRLPFHKYVGPGNELNNGDPVDEDDNIAQVHDNDYERAQNQEQIREADTHAINDFIGSFQSGNLHSAIGAAGLAIKRGAEDIVGPIYGMSKKEPRYQPYLGLGHNNHHRDSSQSSQESQLETPHGYGSQRFDNPQSSTIEEPPIPTEKGKKRINIISNQKVKSPDQPPAKKIGIATPNNSQQSSQGSSLNLADFFQNFDPGMEVDQGAPGDVLGTGVGTKAGSGPGMGSAGSMALGTPSTINVPKMSGIPFKHTLHQQFRFIVPSCLTKQRCILTANKTQSGTAGSKSLWERQLYIGSSLGIDMSRIAQYMDANTYMSLSNNCTTWKAGTASLDVISLGVRAPYSTAQSNIEVANANLQANVCDISDFQHDYGIQITDEIDSGGYIAKLWGGTFQNYKAIPWTAEFANISSRFETRVLRQRVIIRDLFWSRDEAANPMSASDVQLMDPNYCQYIKKSVNGSNLLGTAFQHKTEFNRTQHINAGTMRQPIPASGRGTTYRSMADNSGIELITPTMPIDVNDSPVTQNCTFQGFDGQSGVVAYEYASLFGYLKNDVETPNVKDRYALYSIYNLRNFVNDPITDTGTAAYNSIIDMNWEVILSFSLDISGEYITPMFANVMTAVTGQRNKRNMIRDAGDLGNNWQSVYRVDTVTQYPNVPRYKVSGLNAGGWNTAPKN